jgi:hypothetical protein
MTDRRIQKSQRTRRSIITASNRSRTSKLRSVVERPMIEKQLENTSRARRNKSKKSLETCQSEIIPIMVVTGEKCSVLEEDPVLYGS